MSQYILINKITVENANAVAGFTWGFPAITHFLGFTHHLERKMAQNEKYNDVLLKGCSVIAHQTNTHSYDAYNDKGKKTGARFTQSRTAPYLEELKNIEEKSNTPPIIEEGKMNMTVSLLLEVEENLGNKKDSFINWLTKTCYLQRLAGGTIQNISDIEIYDLSQNSNFIYEIKRKLLPGFFLQDRSSYLEEYYEELQEDNPDAELLEAWLDFIALKQKARPKSNLINKHLIQFKHEEHEHHEIFKLWVKHLSERKGFDKNNIPNNLIQYFSTLEQDKSSNNLLKQWHDYINPTEKTEADWEYLKKPNTGYLVPIMTGYKAISEVYPNNEKNPMEGARDNKTDVCFVESVHSIGEWESVHRIKNAEQLKQCIWHYHYEENWYLCKQNQQSSTEETLLEIEEIDN